MKKIILFFIALFLLVLTFGTLYFTGAIYDAGRNMVIRPYFFQPNFLSEYRPGTPKTQADIGDSKFMDLLVKKYINEYFYASPDPENIAKRLRNNSIIAKLSSQKVFNEWEKTEGEIIKDLAEKKALRIARVLDEIYKPSNSDYWVINYELKTWIKPNDFSIVPETERGTLYMKILYEPGMRDDVNLELIHEYLENGNDPAAVFKFRVIELLKG